MSGFTTWKVTGWGSAVVVGPPLCLYPLEVAILLFLLPFQYPVIKRPYSATVQKLALDRLLVCFHIFFPQPSLSYARVILHLS